MRSRSKFATLVLALLGATVLGRAGDVLRTRPSAAPVASAHGATPAPVAPAAGLPTSAAPAADADASARIAPVDASDAAGSRARAASEGARSSESRDARIATEGGTTTVRRTRAARVRPRLQPRVQPMPTLVIGAPAQRTSEW